MRVTERQAPKRPSLRRRLLLWLLPSTFLLVLCWLWASYAIVIHFVNVAYDRSLEDTVETIEKQVELTSEGFAVDLPPAAKRMLEFDRFDQIYYRLSDERGRDYLSNIALPAPLGERPNSHGSTFYDATVNGSPVRIVQTSVRSPNGSQLDIRVAETRQKRKILAYEVMTYMVAPQSFFLGGIILLIWIGVGRGVAPLARVRDAIARLNPTDLRQIDEPMLPAERLTEQLLALSRIEAHDPERTRFETFPINDALAGAVAWAVPTALRKNIDIKVDVPAETLSFYGDRHAVEQLIANLIDNAILYTPENGLVCVELSSDGSSIQLVVEDNGPGIAEEDRERVMERFDRGHHSAEKGTGLGLSIAKEVARLHHGHLTLASATPNGLRVEVFLPFSHHTELMPPSPANPA